MTRQTKKIVSPKIDMHTTIFTQYMASTIFFFFVLDKKQFFLSKLLQSIEDEYSLSDAVHQMERT